MPGGYSLTELGDKQVFDLIDEDVQISPEGAVTGTLKYVNDWTEFSSVESEQSGHYFPITLDSQYSGKMITCTGEKESKAEDLEWVLYVKDNNSTFTFKADDGDVFLTLTFTGATLQEDLNKVSLRELKQIAADKGYTITATRKTDVLKEIMEQGG